MTDPLVPPDFEVPPGFAGPGFSLEPLGPHHNERDHVAWMSSNDHIRATPGFESWAWPEPMSLEENLSDLGGHAAHFRDRVGFTYSIVDGGEVMGCLYIYPARDQEHDAEVRSWVRVSRANMDAVVWESVSAWLREVWPFQNPLYAARI